jgi:predicted nucleic acid-binding protein
MILVDTSVWIDHLHRTVVGLSDLLVDGLVVGHPAVVGELALGSLRDRGTVLTLLDRLPRAQAATETEVRHLVEERALWGRGLGLVDAHLLASTLITPDCRLWSRDKRLRAAADQLGVGSRER